MLYTRSSFIQFLVEKRDCEIAPMESRALEIKNGPVKAYLWTDKKNRIDYEEIYAACKKLFIDLPGDSELERIE